MHKSIHRFILIGILFPIATSCSKNQPVISTPRLFYLAYLESTNENSNRELDSILGKLNQARRNEVNELIYDFDASGKEDWIARFSIDGKKNPIE